MKVSYIIIFYNQERWVNEAIQAAYLQSHKDIEFIFSDDCSKDGTLAEIKKAVDAAPEGLRKITRILSSPSNLGIVGHTNKVLSHATGSIIAMIAGDDLSLPNWVARAADCFKDPNIGLVACNQIRIDQSGNIIDCSNFSAGLGKPFPQIMADESIGLPGAGAIWRAEVFSHFGALPNDIQNEDDQTLIRAALLGKIAILEETLFLYRVHSSSASAWLREVRGSARNIIDKQIEEHHNRIAHCRHWQNLILKSNRSDKAELRQGLDQKILHHEKSIGFLQKTNVADIFSAEKKLEAAALVFSPALTLRSIRFYRKLRHTIGKFLRRHITKQKSHQTFQRPENQAVLTLIASKELRQEQKIP